MKVNQSVTDIHGMRARKTMEMTSYLMHKHYCENDVEAIISMFDDRLSWFGAGEDEYDVGTEKVTEIFRQFAGKVPRCNILDEEYDVIEITPQAYLCTGRMWIETDPSTGVFLRVHQRVSMIFRWPGKYGGEGRCCHIHISNPYIEMMSGDIGFPTRVARHTHDYMQEQISLQKRQIEEQTFELTSIYNTVPCGIIRLLQTEKDGYTILTFNRTLCELLDMKKEEISRADWSQGFSENVMPKDAEEIRKSLAALKEPGDSSFIDYQIRTYSGKKLYLSCTNSLISADERGRIIQRIIFDISQRVELEHALKRLSFQDTLTGLFNRNRFNQVMNMHDRTAGHLGIAYFDLNGLKEVNDRMGHSAGDDLICRTASHIARFFAGKTYRIGGDEFVVIDEESQEEDFRSRVASACENMKKDDISIAVGLSWRSHGCDIEKQFEEADHLMYKNKEEHYAALSGGGTDTADENQEYIIKWWK